MSEESSDNNSFSSQEEEETETPNNEPAAKKPRTEPSSGPPPLNVPLLDGNGPAAWKKQQPIIILLDQASIETVKNRRGVYELLNCDDHRELCKKKLKKDPNFYRPDILHQELLALLDSPLNKAGMLKLYIHTSKNVLIEVHPSVRIPRTFKRFAGLMVQLLHKLKIKAGTDSTTLFKVIKNPFSQHLPPGTHCYGLSCQGSLFSPIALAKRFVPALPDESVAPTCFIAGAMSTGHVTITDHPYIEEMFSISEYPLSGAVALSRLLGGIEQLWGIV